MIRENGLRNKISDMKGRVKDVVNKFAHRSDKNVEDTGRDYSSRDESTSRGDKFEFQPDKEKSFTAPDPSSDILSDGSTSRAQNLVWENENSSMQDKTYSFDEDNTDADYDTEDDLDFQDMEDDSGSGQESRYS